MSLPSARYLTISNIHLACYEQNSAADKTIFFIHSNSSSAKLWESQFESPLLSDYRLVAIDLPAHGNSGGSIVPAEDYNLPVIGRIAAEAFNILCPSDSSILVGFSFGTNVLAEMLNHSIHCKGIVIAGPTVMGTGCTADKVFINLAESVLFTDDSEGSAVTTFFSNALHGRDPKHIQLLEEDYYRVKKPFRSALFNSVMAGKISDEVILLEKQNIPALVVFGQEERSVHKNYLDHAPLKFWQNKIFTIPGAGHCVSLEQPEAFNELLTAYAMDRLRES